MSSAYIYEAIRTPFGRYGGALSAVRPDDLAAVVLKALLARVPAARTSTDRRRHLRHRQRLRRGQPRRCAHGSAARRLANLGTGRDRQPPLWLEPRGCDPGRPRDRDRRCRDRRRRRRRGDESLALDPREAVTRFPGRQRDAVLLDARMAHGEPEDAVAVDDLARREHREAGRDARHHARAAGRVRAAQPPAGGQGLRRKCAQGGRARPR